MKDVQEDRAVLSLNHSEVPEWKEQYPYAWEAEIEVWLDEVPSTLSMRARVRNVGDDIMPFTFAFHTYLRAEADSVRVEGLEGLEYWDNTNNRRTQVDDQSHLTPRSEIDRVYFSAPESVRVLDTAYQREILVRKRNLSGVVVWNPWIEKAMALVDMDDLEYKEMICIEPVEVQTIRLPPGQTWEAEQRLEVRKLGLSKAPAL